MNDENYIYIRLTSNVAYMSGSLKVRTYRAVSQKPAQ